ncbi:MAG: hypothetical protein GTO40_20355 [Deltaproteobacteria bacterium]|nr:hypothetical protein [Deltaproteobacteria bacterium]
MSRGPLLTYGCFFLLLILFIAGVGRLFVLRFEKGDVYPPYSTLRADPLGSKVFYESLKILPNLEVKRNYSLRDLRTSTSPDTWFYLGLSRREMDFFDLKIAEAFEERIQSGGRLFVSIVPEDRLPKENKKNKSGQKSELKKNDPKTPSDHSKDKDKVGEGENGSQLMRYVFLAERWGFALENVAFKTSASKNTQANLAESPANGLPESILWLTTLVFKDLDEAWRVIYQRDGRAVLAERSWGKGSVVLSTDSYFVSNEALMSHRYPGLLAWTVGHHQSVVFDETHFGVTEKIGIAALARKYRLHGLFFGLLVLAVVYVWKNGSGFVPAYCAEDRGSSMGGEILVEGKDAASGFNNLLRRSLPSNELLRVCFQEWKKTLPKFMSRARSRLEAMEAVLRQNGVQKTNHSDPVSGYQKMLQIWTEGKR